MSENMNEGFLIAMEDPNLVTVPIDPNLEQEGAAADAKAVGDALALKANISDIVGVSVNGEAADNQGVILIDGSIIPVSDAPGAPMISAAMEQALEEKTAADIPMSSEEDAETVAEAIEELREGAAGCVKSVNGEEPDENGNVQITEVPAAQNLTSDSSQAVVGAFSLRTAGGSRSVKSGLAQMQEIRGAMVHTDQVQEVLMWDVTGDDITADIDRAEWVDAVNESGTYEFSFNGAAWELNGSTVTLADYGITIDGTPANGNGISVTYTKEDRGVITPATPGRFVATGWNLFNAAVGYARVKKYDYKYHIGGDFTGLQFSATVNGTRTNITVEESGSFDVPSDGYVWPTGASAANTYICTEWTDWTNGPDAEFESYSESSIDLTGIMSEVFPDGLLAVGAVYDEINLGNGKAVSRIEKLDYDEETLAAIIAQGRAYDADTDYIYAVKTSFIPVNISISNQYQENDHGLEMFTGTDVGIYTIILYGQDLKAKLINDVVTISPMNLPDAQQAQFRENIGATGIPRFETYNSAAQVFESLASGVTITQCYANRYGAMVYLNFEFKLNRAITVTSVGNITNINLGVLKSDFRPISTRGMNLLGFDSNDKPEVICYSDKKTLVLGALRATGSERTIPANTLMACAGTYISATVKTD